MAATMPSTVRGSRMRAGQVNMVGWVRLRLGLVAAEQEHGGQDQPPGGDGVVPEGGDRPHGVVALAAEMADDGAAADQDQGADGKNLVDGVVADEQQVD